MRALLNSPISTAELERRWIRIRNAMKAAKIDALLITSSNDFVHGYKRYLTDTPAFGYPSTLVFPIDGTMTLIGHGPIGGDNITSAEDWSHRGIGRVLTSPNFASAHFLLHYEAKQVSRALEPYAGGVIGLVGAQAMPVSILDHVRSQSRGGRIVDATDLVDQVKCVRGAEEIAAVRRTAAIQDAAFAELKRSIRPGMKEREVAAEAELINRRLGSEEGVYLCSSGPPGHGSSLRPPHMQERILQKGDVLHLLIESSGPGGLYSELGRTFVLGKASTNLKNEFKFVLDARKFTLDRLRPGKPPADTWHEYNAFMRENGRPEERRLHSHAQGYDLVERPLIHADEIMPLQPGMIFACHPTYIASGELNWICDSYLISEAEPERLHRQAEELMEIY